MHPRRASAALACAPLLALAPRPAAAGDALRERTPVIHLGESCLTVIDRAATPVVHLEYTFPFEDTCAGAHPPPSHQFFALCRPPAPGEALPQWISRADLEAAAALGIALPPFGADEVLEESPAWAGCWARITADDDRRPLTCEAALAGVDWDVSAAPAGVQVVAAYTYHPPRNRWSTRWGVFALVDGDADAIAPVAAIANRAGFVYADEVMSLRACASAPAGSTLRFEYAVHADEPAWAVAVDEVAVDAAEVAVPWDPPASVEAQDVRLRVTIRDPLGRSRTLESPELQAMLAVPSPPGGGVDPPPPLVDTCRDAPTPAQLPCPSAGGEVGEDTTSTGDATGEGAAGCACAADRPGARRLAALSLLLGLVVRRRRGAAPTCR